MVPTLIIKTNFGDEMKIETGRMDDDFVHAKHTVKLTIEQGIFVGKAKDRELESFAIRILKDLGYVIKG